MPDIGQMAWRSARRKKDHVYSHVVTRLRQVVPEDFGRRRHPRRFFRRRFCSLGFLPRRGFFLLAGVLCGLALTLALLFM